MILFASLMPTGSHAAWVTIPVDMRLLLFESENCLINFFEVLFIEGAGGEKVIGLFSGIVEFCCFLFLKNMATFDFFRVELSDNEFGMVSSRLELEVLQKLVVDGLLLRFPRSSPRSSEDKSSEETDPPFSHLERR